jgi:hypothetical protein
MSVFQHQKIVVKVTCLSEESKAALRKLEKLASNIVLEDGDIKTDPETQPIKDSRILVI